MKVDEERKDDLREEKRKLLEELDTLSKICSC